jgi:thiol-disulfide isomerase/thioredoxin
MKLRIFLFCIINLLIVVVNAQTKPKTVSTLTSTAPIKNINITLAPLKNCWVYLGSYYGKGKVLSDSAYLNNVGVGSFKGDKKLTPGIYFIVSPQYTIQFDLLIGNNQQFSIKGDTAQKEHPIITGSLDNDIFKNYSAFTTEKGKTIAALTQQLSVAKNTQDSAKTQAQVVQLNKEIADYRNKILKEYPKSLLATLLMAMKRPDVPAIPVVNGKADSTYPYRFVKEHFWDGVDFNDDRLLRTPFFEPKLDDYYKYYVSPEPDSIIKEINYQLLYARTGKEIYPYLLTKFTNKYINPEYMGQDKVFLFLFENFYAKGDTALLNPSSRKTITETAYSMMANQIGIQASELNVTDTLGNAVSLYNIKSPFTFIVFWDPTCGHCKEELPKIDSIYKAKWKVQGIALLSINIHENLMKELKTFVNEKKFSSDWIHAYQTKAAMDKELAAGKPNYRQLYYVKQTPTMYLLDAEKRIIGKQLSLEQFDNLIEMKLKQKEKK